MGGVTSYFYPSYEDVPIPENERLSYVVARDIHLHKRPGEIYHRINPESKYSVDKIIPRGTNFSVVRIVKDVEGNKKILAKFEGEDELMDVTYAFVCFGPLVARMNWIQDSLTTSMFIQKPNQLGSPFRYYSKSY